MAADPSEPVGPLLVEAQRSQRFFAAFSWYARRMVRGQFNALRITPETERLLRSLDACDSPVLVALTHCSWWDPILSVALASSLHPSRSAYGVIDAHELSKFKFMRKLGLFGVDPDDPASLALIQEYIERLATEEHRLSLWITPQGRFTDVREPVQIRPGAASIAASVPGARVAALAIEYTFWNDRRPELLVHGTTSMVTPGSTPRTHRDLEESLRSSASALSALARARDPEPFVTLVSRGGAINPAYDAWMRIRGRSSRIDSPRPHRSARAAP